MSAYPDAYALTVFGPISVSTDQNAPLRQLITWFSNFQPFVYDSTIGIKDNFNRLAI
ncbi:Nn.00g088400.m01.CDS01 [Neocucurbitaria sp. VM-36]